MLSKYFFQLRLVSFDEAGWVLLSSFQRWWHRKWWSTWLERISLQSFLCSFDIRAKWLSRNKSCHCWGNEKKFCVDTRLLPRNGSDKKHWRVNNCQTTHCRSIKTKNWLRTEIIRIGKYKLILVDFMWQKRYEILLLFSLCNTQCLTVFVQCVYYTLTLQSYIARMILNFSLAILTFCTGLVFWKGGRDSWNATTIRWTEISGSTGFDLCYSEVWSSSLLSVRWNWSSSWSSSQVRSNIFVEQKTANKYELCLISIQITININS